ncbi:MAG: hypothetical protein CSB33_01505 [Desulfobacterales bacterium]|nr:MAG: hypothetical protein CSB33_01505 [Desulfobacterales bacterium]
MNQFVLVIQRLGAFLRELNEKFYFRIDIDTVIPWAIIFLMYFLHKLLDKYLKDGIIDSMELLRLLAIYLLMILGIMASYVDVGVIAQRANPQYSFFIIIIAVFFIVIFIAWSTSQTTSTNLKERIRLKNNEKRWILGALYLPILLIILTNGRILERRSETFQHMMPRTDITFVDLPGEVMSLWVGGEVSREQLEQLELLISSHDAIRECAVVGKQDVDNLIKPEAYVVLAEGYTGNAALAEKIKNFVEDKIRENWVSSRMYPYWIEFVDRLDLKKLGSGDPKYDRVREMLKSHPAVEDCRIVGLPDKSTAYVTLKEGNTPSKEKGKEIIQHAYDEIKRNNRMSLFLVPRWVEFVDKNQMPRNSYGEINHNALQKRAKNWSDLFPNPPKDDAFVKQMGG